MAGSLVALTIIAVLAFCCLRKKDQNEKVKALQEEEEEEKNWAAPVSGKNAKRDIPMKGK